MGPADWAAATRSRFFGVVKGLPIEGRCGRKSGMTGSGMTGLLIALRELRSEIDAIDKKLKFIETCITDITSEECGYTVVLKCDTSLGKCNALELCMVHRVYCYDKSIKILNIQVGHNHIFDDYLPKNEDEVNKKIEQMGGFIINRAVNVKIYISGNNAAIIVFLGVPL